MIPIAAVAIAIKSDHWFSKLREAQTPAGQAQLWGLIVP